ncbi:membrane protein [Capnocytophaga cynodegmi]|uniref:trimeric intracellular cation channel family protein n=1 Tax=Capnocytophaga cynodegmi TaxID=28189 RepID=UPI001AC7600C|nr:trimeric intracellular cation channel family protein [Capnocytophaga cynodegmi]GIM51628.1 membrane protein [Capnocytophaga cynodegmi]
MDLFYIVDLAGVFVFAISGALAAREKKLDLFGVFIIAFVTGLGGGTLRDVMMGRTPVFWMQAPIYVGMIFGGTFFAIIFRKKMHYLRKSLLLFDTIGIAFFSIIGTEIALSFSYDLHPIIVISIAAMSACFGGVIRDILCNEIPIIFHKEIYATPCVTGSLVYLGLREINLFDDYISSFIAIAFIIAFRLFAIKRSLELPKID